MIGDNEQRHPDWQLPAPKHCGLVCFDIACPVCGDYLPLHEGIVLGEN